MSKVEFSLTYGFFSVGIAAAVAYVLFQAISVKGNAKSAIEQGRNWAAWITALGTLTTLPKVFFAVGIDATDAWATWGFIVLPVYGGAAFCFGWVFGKLFGVYESTDEPNDLFSPLVQTSSKTAYVDSTSLESHRNAVKRNRGPNLGEFKPYTHNNEEPSPEIIELASEEFTTDTVHACWSPASDLSEELLELLAINSARVCLDEATYRHQPEGKVKALVEECIELNGKKVILLQLSTFR